MKKEARKKKRMAALEKSKEVAAAKWLLPKALDENTRLRGEVAWSRSSERPELQAKAKMARPQLEVSGCEDPNLARALEGGYLTEGCHHNKIMYKKLDPDTTGSVDAVYLYYWDDPGDPEKVEGWWSARLAQKPASRWPCPG